MKQQHKITIDRQDIVDFLASKGIQLPDQTYIGGSVQFPIVFEWEVNSDRLLIKPRVVPYDLHHQPTIDEDRILSSMRVRQYKIEAIKAVRGWYGWGLKEGKEWVEFQYWT